jgi:effector-binding domain-containing protein
MSRAVRPGLTVMPEIVARAAQPYVGIRQLVTMQTIAQIADRLPEVFGWLDARGIEPAGAPFFKYNVIDMERELDVEVGVPTGAAVPGEGEVFGAVLPAGRYATLTHVGHPDELVTATAVLLAWAAGQGLNWDVVDTAAGERWGCRLEVYNTNPAEEPDMHKWETDLFFRLGD